MVAIENSRQSTQALGQHCISLSQFAASCREVRVRGSYYLQEQTVLFYHPLRPKLHFSSFERHPQSAASNQSSNHGRFAIYSAQHNIFTSISFVSLIIMSSTLPLICTHHNQIQTRAPSQTKAMQHNAPMYQYGVIIQSGVFGQSLGQYLTS